jgi:hypothetical protein
MGIDMGIENSSTFELMAPCDCFELLFGAADVASVVLCLRFDTIRGISSGLPSWLETA